MSNNSSYFNESDETSASKAFAIFMTTLTSLVLVLGVSGNVLALLAIVLVRQLHTTSNALIANLAVSDIGALLTGLTTLVMSLYGGEKLSQADWICQSLLHVTFLFVFTSILTLQCIAVDRYVIITKPRHVYRQYFSSRGLYIILGGTWTMAMLFTVVILSVGDGAIWVEEILVCYIDNSDPYSWWCLTAALLLACVSCLFVIPYFFTRTFMKIRATRMRVEESTSQLARANKSSLFSREEVAVTRMMLVVYLTFTVCWVPMLILHFTHYGSYPRYEVHHVFSLMAILNSALNPMVYAGMNRRLRLSFKKVVKCKPKQSRTETFSLNYTS